MIHHIVLFKFYEGTTQNEIQELVEALIVMKNKIPGITRYIWGPSVSIEHLEKGYTHGFIMSFKNEKYRNEYVPHPLHKELIKKFVDPICEAGLVFDIEE